MIAVFACFLLLGLYLGLTKPNYFVIFYLLASTKFLGFLDIEQMFVFGGTGLGMPSLNAITFATAFAKYTKTNIPRRFHLFIFSFSLFLLYGILHPVFLGFESFMQAFITSKEYWCLSFLIYLASYRGYLEERLLISFIKFIGLYLTSSYVIFHLTSISAPNFYANGIFRTYFPTYISLAMFFYYYDYLSGLVKLKKTIFCSLYLFIGLILASHFSLVIGTAATLSMYYCIYSKSSFSISRLFIRSIIIFYAIILVFSTSSKLRNTVNDQVQLITSGEDIALKSRDIYNSFRLAAIADRPLTGYGLVHKSATITKKYQVDKNNRFSQRFNVIDSGYIDLMITFGYIGTSLYLFMWGLLIFKVLKNTSRYSVLQLLMAYYLLQYFPVNFTWSVFSFSHGLIPAFLAIYIILNTYNHNNHSSSPN